MPDNGLTGRIKIISVPDGEAPKWVRQAWVGLELPTYPFRTVSEVEFGVVTRRQQPGRRSMLAVPIYKALEVLERYSPEAAQWWREHAPTALHFHFCFSEHEIEILSGVERQEIRVWDDMETGHWRRVL